MVRHLALRLVPLLVMASAVIAACSPAFAADTPGSPPAVAPGRWTVDVLPAEARSVSCVSAVDCTAVGAYRRSTDRAGAAAWAWNGSAWSPQPLDGVSPRNTLPSLSLVVCPVAGQCIAKGGRNIYPNDSPYSPLTTPFFAVLGEGRWTSFSADSRKLGSDLGFDGLSCFAPDDCWAVGYRKPSLLSQGAAAQHWNGVRWKAVAVPRSKPTTRRWRGLTVYDNYGLSSVSCATAQMCVAVGHAGINAGPTTVMRWNGSRWQLDPVRVPRGGRFTGVSCPAATFCIAVGGVGDSGFSYRWNGRTWRRASIRGNETRPFGPVGDVACITATDCVSNYGYGGPNQRYGRWDGRSWTFRRSAKKPTVATCPKTGRCVLAPA